MTNSRQQADADMLVDDYEQINNDRTDVVVVSRSGSEGDQDAEILANDCRIPHLCGPFTLVYTVTMLFCSRVQNTSIHLLTLGYELIHPYPFDFQSLYYYFYSR